MSSMGMHDARVMTMAVTMVVVVMVLRVGVPVLVAAHAEEPAL